MGNWDKAIAFVLVREGGFQANQSDPGNYVNDVLVGTNFGICARDHPNEDIRNMTVDRAKEIYRSEYWTPIGGDALPDGVSLALMDSAVNQGVLRSIKWMQVALDVHLIDGIVGPRTVAAANNPPKDWLIRFLTLRGVGYVHDVIGNPVMRSWVANWMQRLFEVQAAVIGG